MPPMHKEVKFAIVIVCCIIVALALILLAWTITGDINKTTTTKPTTTTTTTTNTTTSTTTTTTTVTTTTTTTGNSSTPTPEPEPDVPEEDNGFTFVEKNDTLVVISSAPVELREKADASSPVKTTVIKGTALKRIGVASEDDGNGNLWSKVIYDGSTYYVSSDDELVAIKNNSDESNEKFDLLFGGNYSITLPASYDIVAQNATQYDFSNGIGKVSVKLDKMADPHDDIWRIAANTIYEMKLSGVSVENGTGFVYFTYTETLHLADGDKTVTHIVAFHKTDNGNYYVTHISQNGSASSTQDALMTYVLSIKIK